MITLRWALEAAGSKHLVYITLRIDRGNTFIIIYVYFMIFI